MPHYAIISNESGVCLNRIIADATPAVVNPAGFALAVSTDSPVGPGWRWTVEAWMPPLPPARTREQLCAAINAERNRRLDGLTVVAAGRRFDADSISRANLDQALRVHDLTGAAFPRGWIDADNAACVISLADAHELVSATAAAVDALYALAYDLKNTWLGSLDDAELASADPAADHLWGA